MSESLPKLEGIQAVVFDAYGTLFDVASPVHALAAELGDAAAALAQSIQNGSRGKWGRVPMPGHPSLSQADLKTLAQWVLATKP